MRAIHKNVSVILRFCGFWTVPVGAGVTDIIAVGDALVWASGVVESVPSVGVGVLVAGGVVGVAVGGTGVLVDPRGT